MVAESSVNCIQTKCSIAGIDAFPVSSFVDDKFILQLALNNLFIWDNSFDNLTLWKTVANICTKN